MVLEVNLIYFPTLAIDAFPFLSFLRHSLIVSYFFGDGAILSLFGDEFLKVGICVKCSLSSIRLEICDENSSTCFLIYLRKLSLFHLPISRIVESSAPDSFIAMAPPDLIECVPISFASKPNDDVSIDFTILRRKSMLSLLDMLYSLFLI